MEIYYLLPKALQYGTLIASVLFPFLLWRQTRILGFLLLSVLIVLGRAYSSFVVPYIAKTSGTGTMIAYNLWVSALFGVVGAFAWWNIYVRTKRADA